MTISTPTTRGGALSRSGRAALVAVVAAAVVRAVAVPLAWWTLHGYAVESEIGSGARGPSVSAVGTIAIALLVSGLALLVAGPIFLVWLSGARSGRTNLSGARHRLGTGWVVGAWLVPIANYVLPCLVVLDVWRAMNAADRTARPTPVYGWWLATVAARVAHLVGWVLLVSSFGRSIDAEVIRTVAVLHTVAAFLTLASAGLLALIIIETDRGLRLLATLPRPEGASMPSSPPPDDPLVADGVVGLYTRIAATIRRSGVQLLALEAITAVASVVYLLIVWPMHRAPGDPDQAVVPVAMSDWLTVLLPATAVVLAVFMVVRSASLVVVLRQAAGRPVSVGEALREAGRRSPRLVGWTVAIVAALTLVGYLAFLSGSLLVIGVLLFPLCLVAGLVLNLTLVGVVTVEGGHLGRCLTLLRSWFWPALGRYLSIFPVFIVFSIVTNLAYLVDDPLARAVLLTVVAVPFYLFVSALAAAVYAELRHHESGGQVRTPDLVTQMDDPEHRPPVTTVTGE